MDHKMRKFKKHYYLNTPNHVENETMILDSLSAEMVLEKSLRDFRKEQIKKEIDLSLLQRNKEEFLRLMKELESIS